MKLSLPYGSEKIPLCVPDGVPCVLLEPAQVPAVGDVRSELKGRVENPTDAAPLADMVRPDSEIVILVSDATRRTAADVILPPLLDLLNDYGAKDDDITILIACGSHERHSPGEIRALLGTAVTGRIHNIEHHDCYDEHMLIPLGSTSQGVPVAINRIVLESDLVIATGAVNFHYFAGYGSGRKAIVPGCAGFETILANHRLTLSDVPEITGPLNPYCDSGVLDENPVHEAALEAARMVENVFLLNTVLNAAGEICDIFAGDLDAAHREACKTVDEIYGVEAAEPFDLVIASSGGFPHDVNLIQMHKGIHHATGVLREGGHLVFLGEARDGVGSATFAQWFDFDTPEEMAAAMRSGYTLNAHTAYAMREKARRFDISLMSMLTEDFVREMGLRPVSDLQSRVNEIIGKLGSPRTALIPHANLLLPVLKM